MNLGYCILNQTGVIFNVVMRAYIRAEFDPCYSLGLISVYVRSNFPV